MGHRATLPMGAVGEFVPANMRESNAQAATLQQLSFLHDERLQRLAELVVGEMSPSCREAGTFI